MKARGIAASATADHITLLYETARAYGAAGYEVIGIAAGTAALDALACAGIVAYEMDKFLASRDGIPLDAKTAILLDADDRITLIKMEKARRLLKPTGARMVLAGQNKIRLL